MLNQKEIGKKRSKKSLIDAYLNRIFVTPNGDQYSLIAYEKNGKCYNYVYKWINCPQDILEITNNTLRSKSPLTLEEIINWISELKSLIK